LLLQLHVATIDGERGNILSLERDEERERKKEGERQTLNFNSATLHKMKVVQEERKAFLGTFSFIVFDVI
jgi:hypothetical protein